MSLGKSNALLGFAEPKLGIDEESEPPETLIAKDCVNSGNSVSVEVAIVKLGMSQPQSEAPPTEVDAVVSGREGIQLGALLGTVI